MMFYKTCVLVLSVLLYAAKCWNLTEGVRADTMPLACGVILSMD